ncbi:MAG TPA: hypothetical protein VM781_00575, partial [Candidatus Bathyarchaeia archaeon]|nr:hypothetical protein [Candidatus Bathyarchaeia archaeon]
MKNHRFARFMVIFALLGACGSAAVGQDRVFNWLPANDESVRLDPANYHTGRTYHPGLPGTQNHVDIKAEKPVTIFMAPAEEWSAVLQNPASIAQLHQICRREHVVETTYVCDLATEPTTLVIQDERNNPDAAVFAGLGAVLKGENATNRAIETGIATVLTGSGSATRRFVSPNDVHIQYYRWDCVQNCVQPEIAWQEQVKEKYQLSAFLKIYGGFAADHDAESVSIKIKSPVPMLVAMLPSAVANQLHEHPESLEPALEKSACQQRGIQSMQFECKFNVNDGPQSLIVVPEETENVPKKKAEIELFAARCV